MIDMCSVSILNSYTPTRGGHLHGDLHVSRLLDTSSPTLLATGPRGLFLPGWVLGRPRLFLSNMFLLPSALLLRLRQKRQNPTRHV